MAELETNEISDSSSSSVDPVYQAATVSAKNQMDFQERMSNTAHQREVTDLVAAGLNPVLSAGGSGATTPQGAAGDYGSSAKLFDIMANTNKMMMQTTMQSSKALSSAMSSISGMAKSIASSSKASSDSASKALSTALNEAYSKAAAKAYSDSINSKDAGVSSKASQKAAAAQAAALEAAEAAAEALVFKDPNYSKYVIRDVPEERNLAYIPEKSNLLKLWDRVYSIGRSKNGRSLLTSKGLPNVLFLNDLALDLANELFYTGYEFQLQDAQRAYMVQTPEHKELMDEIASIIPPAQLGHSSLSPVDTDASITVKLKDGTELTVPKLTVPTPKKNDDEIQNASDMYTTGFELSEKTQQAVKEVAEAVKNTVKRAFSGKEKKLPKLGAGAPELKHTYNALK